jgi:hypothetical protein
MNIWKVTTVAFAGLFAATVAFHAVPSADAEAQPRMKTALAHLKKAQLQLEKASADKGGHRAKAIELVKKAIEETKQGIEFDSEH